MTDKLKLNLNLWTPKLQKDSLQIKFIPKISDETNVSVKFGFVSILQYHLIYALTIIKCEVYNAAKACDSNTKCS